jgi:deoxyadenosine/deoxycytidine kinase
MPFKGFITNNKTHKHKHKHKHKQQSTNTPVTMKISIEGNIGCGKSSVITRLCQEFRIPVFLEPVDEWKEWLSMFYADPNRWGLSFNINVLLSFNKWKNNDFTAIYERSPLSNRYIFAKLQYDQQRMMDIELKMFETLYEKLAWTPDVVIYIQTDPEVSMERMRERGRSCENEVSFDYIKAVHDKYEDLFGQSGSSKRTNKCHTIIVNGNRSKDAVYADVAAIVNHYNT